jgi:hypothetical protein
MSCQPTSNSVVATSAPCHIILPCHFPRVRYDPAMSAPCHIIFPCHFPRVRYDPATSALRTVLSTIFFLVWKIEQNVICHSSNVCLNLFEVCWFFEDEAYAPVYFEVIPNTLLFGINFYPWSKF